MVVVLDLDIDLMAMDLVVLDTDPSTVMAMDTGHFMATVILIMASVTDVSLFTQFFT